MVESRRVQSGFSLMELMIAVAIVAILASIAYPSYVGYIQQARRADAVASLMELAQFMERYYTENHRYRQSDGSAPVLPFTEAPKSGATKFYDLTITTTADNSYTLTATPKGGQSGDGCGSFSLNHLGVRGHSGSLSADNCWL
ncbi:type IV pilin protein [Ectothiorhodospiraceae bacterium BW-2]|nr:type IV pilin protein [Ectothiorhodospiraceae bacterium BW-2]